MLKRFLKKILFKFGYKISKIESKETLNIVGIDEKVKKLTLELRCMTCQNQSIYDSDAEFSENIKKIVKTKFTEGKSEKEIKHDELISDFLGFEKIIKRYL